MCAAVSFDVKPKNAAFICIVCAVGSSTTTARPAPGEATGGTSFAPARSPTKVIGIASATGTGSVSAVAMARAVRRSVGRSIETASWLPSLSGPITRTVDYHT